MYELLLKEPSDAGLSIFKLLMGTAWSKVSYPVPGKNALRVRQK